MPSAPLRVLLTGFGPFPGMPINPATHVVQAMAADRALRAAPHIDLRTAILPTEWQALNEVERAIGGNRPHLVVMVGVHGTARTPRLERAAWNEAHRKAFDAAGATAQHRRLDAKAPALRQTSLPWHRVIRDLRRRGLPMNGSLNAGRYLCNAGYFAALRARQSGLPARQVLFVHIPVLGAAPMQHPARILATVRAVLATLAGASRRG